MKNKIQKQTFTALMAAILCIMGPIIIPLGMVPLSLTNMVIYLTIILLDKKGAIMSVALYLLIGFVGLPVFAGFTAGAGKLLGPTGGYLIGYLFMCFISGEIMARFQKPVVALLSGTIGLYLFGTVWLMYQSKLELMAALSVGVFPFIVPDIIKIATAVLLGNEVKKRIGHIHNI